MLCYMISDGELKKLLVQRLGLLVKKNLNVNDDVITEVSVNSFMCHFCHISHIC